MVPDSFPDVEARPRRAVSRSQKAAATVMRHQGERRDERLAEIRAQTENGTLVVRHMTGPERAIAGEAARQARERNDGRRKGYRSPSE